MLCLGRKEYVKFFKGRTVSGKINPPFLGRARDKSLRSRQLKRVFRDQKNQIVTPQVYNENSS